MYHMFAHESQKSISKVHQSVEAAATAIAAVVAAAAERKKENSDENKTTFNTRGADTRKIFT